MTEVASYPVIRGSSTGGRAIATTTSSSITRSVPTGTAEGDVIYAELNYGNDNTFTTPPSPVEAGWVQVAAQSSAYGQQQIFRRIWHTGDPTSFKFSLVRTGTSTIYWNVGFVAVTGVDQSSPEDTDAVTEVTGWAADTPFTLGPVDVASDSGVLLLAFAGSMFEGGTWSAGTDGTFVVDVANSYTRIFAKQQPEGENGTLSGSLEVQTTSSVSPNSQSVVVALRPLGVVAAPTLGRKLDRWDGASLQPLIGQQWTGSTLSNARILEMYAGSGSSTSSGVPYPAGVGLGGGNIPLGNNPYTIPVYYYTGPNATQTLNTDGTQATPGMVADSDTMVNALAKMANMGNGTSTPSIALNYSGYGSVIYRADDAVRNIHRVTIYTKDHRPNSGTPVTYGRSTVYSNVPVPDGNIGLTINNIPSGGSDASGNFWDPGTGEFWSTWKLRVRNVNVRLASTANVDVTNFSTLDGVAVNPGDHILLKNQTNQAQNGIWVYNGLAQTLDPPYPIAHAVGYNVDLANPPYYESNNSSNTTSMAGSIVRLNAQTDITQNGYYRWPSFTAGTGTDNYGRPNYTTTKTPAKISSWSGLYDYDGWNPNGTYDFPIPVKAGNVNGGRTWKLNTKGTINQGVTAVTYSELFEIDGTTPWDQSRPTWLTTQGGYIPDLTACSDARYPNGGGASASGNVNEAACLTLAEARECMRRAAAGESLRGAIPHAITLGFPGPAYWKYFSWPAQRSDGTSGSVVYGTRFAIRNDIGFNPEVALAGRHPLAIALAWCALDFGFITNEQAGTVGIGGEGGSAIPPAGPNPWDTEILIDPNTGKTVARWAVFNGLPNITTASWKALPFNYGKPSDYPDSVIYAGNGGVRPSQIGA